MDVTEQIAAAVLYEGYVLWPYRRSAIKNTQRWTFGGVYPRAYSEQQRGSDPWRIQTECLVVGAAPVLQVHVRFLHLVERRVGRMNAQQPQGTLDFVDALQVGGERYLAWEEATEREVTLDDLSLPALAANGATPSATPFTFLEGQAEEPLVAPDGAVAGALVRRWQRVDGTVEVRARPVGERLGGADVTRVTVGIRNDVAWSGTERASALAQTLLSTHAILSVRDGEFVSLMDPPEELKHAAEECQNVKLWPVLVGEEGDRHTLLAAPIILYDFPRVAPESPGDLFDGTEIDQLLTMSILTLSDDEKAEMRATDPRTREILERSESLTPDDLMRLHGAIREFQVLRPAEEPHVAMLQELEAPAPETVQIGGVTIARGSKVRLRPRPGGDIMDLALAGQAAFVEAIEQDYEGTIHLAVTVEADPGRDLGQERQIGHRFFFGLDEVEPLEAAAPGERAGEAEGAAEA